MVLTGQCKRRRSLGCDTGTLRLKTISTTKEIESVMSSASDGELSRQRQLALTDYNPNHVEMSAAPTLLISVMEDDSPQSW